MAVLIRVTCVGGKQDKSQLEVMGDGVDAVRTTSPQNELMKDTIEDEDEQLPPAQLTSPFPRYICAPINYEKTSEWTLLITSLLVEGISASFDQLGYATTSMVMAFVALLLSIVDLIHKARKEGVAGDERSLLPRYYRRSSHNSLHWKPFGGLVEYFGVAEGMSMVPRGVPSFLVANHQNKETCMRITPRISTHNLIHIQWNSSKSSEQVTCMRGCGAVENGEIEQPNGNYASFSRWARVKGEKINERMKILQDLVAGCNKITSKVFVLDEIIHYVKPLQRLVEENTKPPSTTFNDELLSFRVLIAASRKLSWCDRFKMFSSWIEFMYLLTISIKSNRNNYIS
ncbi:hypothetical protein NC652_017939 [Populus alba x Populus x berolinensis]|nr:hypothetical protein NC652_017939 [Populus alba x Populus x berolinensis]